MRTPKLTALDLTVLFNVHGAKARTRQQVELSVALDRLKSGLAALEQRSTPDVLPLVVAHALGRNSGGRGGAPAQLGLPQAPSAVVAPLAAKPAPAPALA